MSGGEGKDGAGGEWGKGMLEEEEEDAGVEG